MSLSKSSKYWKTMSENVKNPEDTTNKRGTEHIENDICFIRKYLKETDDIIDFGSGTGLITNKIVKDVKSIIAIETFENFTKFIEKDIFVINAPLTDVIIRKQFDKIISTGVSQCFQYSDILKIYKNIFKMLKNDGLLIMRTHCGINETIHIDKYSEELEMEYFAEYRHVEIEKKILLNTGFSSVEIFDEVSDSLNVWENTRHYYFVCKK